MAVLVARFAGANEPDKVNRVVYQSFLTAAGMAVVLGAAGWVAAPSLLNLVNAAPEVHAEALPFLRTMFVGIIGMMMFFMLGGAFRAAGDPHTPLRLGVAMTVLTILFNIVLIPAFGTVGAAYGTVASSSLVSVYGIWRLLRPESVIHFEPGMDRRPDFADHPLALQVRTADRCAGNRDEHRRRADAPLHRIAGAQRGGSGGLHRRLRAVVLPDHLDVCRTDGRGRDHRRAEPRRAEAGASDRGRARGVAHRPRRGGRCR